MVKKASENHYGFWTNKKPFELEITTGETIDIQLQYRGEEE